MGLESTLLKASLLLVLAMETTHKLYIAPGFYYKDAERVCLLAVLAGVILLWP